MRGASEHTVGVLSDPLIGRLHLILINMPVGAAAVRRALASWCSPPPRSAVRQNESDMIKTYPYKNILILTRTLNECQSEVAM